MDVERSAFQLSWTGEQLVAWVCDGYAAGRDRWTPRMTSEIARDFGTFPERELPLYVDLPDGRQSANGYLIGLQGLGTGRSSRQRAKLSASAAWVLSAVDLARQAVLSRRCVPSLTVDGRGVWRARWLPVWDDAFIEVVGELARHQPAAAAAATSRAEHANHRQSDPVEFTRGLVEDMVHAVAHQALFAVSWKPEPLLGVRSDEATALRKVTAALSRWDDQVDGLNERAAAVMPSLARAFDHLRARMAGEPVVACRLRLGLPAEADDPWPLTLELFDITDPGRWCSAADVIEQTPLAADLAGSERYLSVLAEAVARGIRTVGECFAGGEFTAPWGADRGAVLALDDIEATVVLDSVEALQHAGVVLTAPSQLLPANAGVRGEARPKAAGSGKFDRTAIVTWTMVVDDAPVDEATLQRAAESGSSLIQVEGRWVRIDVAKARRALKALRQHRQDHSEVDGAELMKLAGDQEIDLVAAADPDAPDGDAGDAVETADRSIRDQLAWTRRLLAGLPDETLTEGTEPETFAFPLRHYQRRGLGWMQFLERVGLGGCLADDMGLGKTPTTLAHLAGRPGPHLVICPLSVVRNWQNEANRFAPFMRVMVHHGGERMKGEAFASAVAEADLVVSTYGLMARDLAAFGAVQWSTVVLDEAQAVKNAHTNAAKAVRKLPAGQRLALTGTPVENRLLELWAILDVVNPGLLGSESMFQKRWANPIEKDRNEQAALGLRRMTSPFVLRRTKADKSLVPDLPDKVEQLAWATLTKEQAAMYQAVVDQLLADAEAASGMKRRGLVLASITRLKQICNHPAHALGDGSRLTGRSGKLARFDELVDDLLDADERALVFTQYREMGDLLQRHLAERLGLAVPFLNGSVSKSKRDAMVERFQAGDGAPLLLVSLKAGGTGLNLTAASRVVHYDRWWNPAVEDQATDRAWRLGQTRSVFVSKLVCQGTVEERISQLIDDKKALAGAVIGTGEGEGWISELSTDQLRDLVTLDRSAIAGSDTK